MPGGNPSDPGPSAPGAELCRAIPRSLLRRTGGWVRILVYAESDISQNAYRSKLISLFAAFACDNVLYHHA